MSWTMNFPKMSKDFKYMSSVSYALHVDLMKAGFSGCVPTILELYSLNDMGNFDMSSS